MESNTSEAAASSTCSTGLGSSDMYPQQQQATPAVVQDFKMPSSLGEVQRIIGLSLSKIQMGRNQRGGLPLHKNLLVATVLNKARDLYMQETMYMNYKMMTGQFAAAASAASSSSGGSNNSQMHEAMHHHSQHYHHHYGMVGSACNNVNAETDDDMEPNVEANEADYDEDSESDVEDECDVTSVPSVASSSHNNHNQNTYPSSMPSSMLLCNLPSSMAAPNASSPHAELSASQPLPNSNVANGQGSSSLAPDAEAVASIGLLGHHPGIGIGINVNEQTPSASDEGFIDEPDCDCDARNFSTSESRVPFQYCYHCAPFHPSSGRGPTLVPSQSPTPNSSSAPSAATSCPSCPSSSSTCQPENSIDAAAATADPAAATALIYDMDSQTTKDSSEGSNLRGTKRRRNSSEDETDEFSQVESGKKRRESTETNDNLETSLLNSSQDESGYQSPSDSSLNEVFHPAFRGSPSCTPSSTPEQSPSNATVVQTESQVASINGQNTMEIDQITSLVSIFSFGQHIMAAAAKAATQKREFQEEEEEDEVSSSNKTSKKPAGSKKSESSEDSDSESDTSSDSGHSSDDHEAAKEEDSNAVTVTKLTRSVSTPDLCAVTSVAVSTTSMASEAPPCVEVASL